MSAKITFRLNNTGTKALDPKKEYTLYFRYRYGRSFSMSKALKTIKLKKGDWNDELCEVRNKSYLVNKQTQNALIHKLKNYFIKKETELFELGETPTLAIAKKWFNDFFTPVEPPKDPKEVNTNFVDFIDSFLKTAHTRTNTKGMRIAKSTIDNYKGSYGVIRDFANENYRLDFDSINLDFYYDLKNWMEIKKGFGLNYFGRIVKHVKVFMNDALEQELTTNRQHLSKRFITVSEKVDAIYLSVDELLNIWNLDLTDNTLIRARDLFLIGAFTGLRISDYNNLNESNIYQLQGVDMIRVNSVKKTGAKVVVPVHPIVKEILKNNGGLPPKKMANQNINLAIKELGRLAEISGNEYTTRTKGGKKVTTKHKKYELICSHSARRSFCTNMYLAGAKPFDIMELSGHKKEQDFYNYIKITQEEKATRLAETSYFNPSHILKKVD